MYQSILLAFSQQRNFMAGRCVSKLCDNKLSSFPDKTWTLNTFNTRVVNTYAAMLISVVRRVWQWMAEKLHNCDRATDNSPLPVLAITMKGKRATKKQPNHRSC